MTNPTIARAVRRLGLDPVGWSIRSLDTMGQSPERVAARILRRLHPGAVILLHDRCAGSERLIGLLVEGLRSRGLEPVTLPELLTSKPMKRLAKLTIACMLLAAVAAPNAARGQEASAAERFAAQFAARSRSVESILCAFTETRHMSVLADDVVRSGTFRYKRPARMALDFDSGDRIVMTGELFLNRMAGRTTTARMNSNPMLRQMQSIFGACMTGDLEALRQTGRMSVTPREGATAWCSSPRAARRAAT